MRIEWPLPPDRPRDLGPPSADERSELLRHMAGRPLAERHRRALDEWQHGRGVDLNRRLYDNAGRDPAGFLGVEEMRLFDDLRDAALAAGELPSPRVVWRGVRADAGDKLFRLASEAMRIGRRFRLDGFSAFSLDPAAASNYAEDGGIVFEAVVSKGAYLPGAQEEIVQVPDVRYRVAGMFEGVEFARGPGETARHAVVQLEEIRDVE